MQPNSYRIAIFGLGYVGLPLAVEFSKKYSVIGYDLKKNRIEELKNAKDSTLEVSREELEACKIKFTDELEDVREANIFIVTVPTPIDQHKQPDLTPLKDATKQIATVLKKGDIVIYESTVYPGVTEDECVPILQDVSGLTYNIDFSVGYSPERINPGDKLHKLKDIVKITSGSTKKTMEIVDELYSSIIEAGTHLVKSIKVAEAAKVSENIQRDINIALINELAKIYSKLNIDTSEVLEAASTKWNFLPFKPGLVGGHCIGVDPYYLTHKAQSLGYHPEIILSGRRINDGMGEYIVTKLVRRMLQERIHVQGANVLLMGVTFKENCPDLRNSKVFDVISELRDYGALVDVFDPWIDSTQKKDISDISLIDRPQSGHYDAIVVAVAHKQFVELGYEQIKSFGKKLTVIFDVKSIFDESVGDIRL